VGQSSSIAASDCNAARDAGGGSAQLTSHAAATNGAAHRGAVMKSERRGEHGVDMSPEVYVGRGSDR